MFAKKNGRSNDEEEDEQRQRAESGHFHVWCITTKNTIDVIAIVPVTAMPYAAASLADSCAQITRPEAGDREQPVDLGHVDLALGLAGRVLDA